jgi:uncharacterized protein (DUF1800 family)
MAALDPLEGKLGLRKAKHLLRRATYNYTKDKINLFKAFTVQEAMDVLIVPSVPILSEPFDPGESSSDAQYWTSSQELPNSFSGQKRKRISVTAQWWYNAYNEVTLAHKLTFFLHTCFTVAKDSGVGPATYFYDHMRLLQFYSMGNLKTLAKKITLDHAMLFYLDNNTNNAKNPNENYAREFLELFTILKGAQKGEGDYTNYQELDIQMAAKVFSGFRNKNDRSVIDSDTGVPAGYADPSKHDASDKTFSSAFGGFVIQGRNTAEGMMEELSDFVDMIFDQDATAVSYVRKLYRHFVKSEWSNQVETEFIAPLAVELKSGGYELLPIIKKILSSTHFFDEDDEDSADEIIGALVKSPLQLFTEMCSLFDVSIVEATQSENLEEYYKHFFQNFVHNSCFGSSGLNFFSPDNVAGYAASYQEPDFDRHWFTSTSIISRYKMVQSLLLGKNLISGSGRFTAVLDSVVFVDVHISDPYNASLIVLELSDLMYSESIDESRQAHFLSVLLGDFDETYWSGAWANYKNNMDDTSARIRLDELVTTMVNAAEFQLT